MSYKAGRNWPQNCPPLAADGALYPIDFCVNGAIKPGLTGMAVDAVAAGERGVQAVGLLRLAARMKVACAPTRSSHLQPLNDGLDAGIGPNGRIE